MRTLEELIESENNKREMVITLGELSDLITKERQEAITSTIERMSGIIGNDEKLYSNEQLHGHDNNNLKIRNKLKEQQRQALSDLKQELLGNK